MNSEGNVAIFWDIETCPPAAGLSGYSLVENIRTIAHKHGSVTSLKGYLDLDTATDLAFNARSLDIRSELQTSGVSLTDCPRVSGSSALTQMLTVDMLSYAYEHARPGATTTIMLISGNLMLSYALSSLRLRKYNIVLLCPSETQRGLRAHASTLIYWDIDVLKRAADADDETPVHSAKPSLSRKLSSTPSAASSELRNTIGSASGSNPSEETNEQPPAAAVPKPPSPVSPVPPGLTRPNPKPVNLVPNPPLQPISRPLNVWNPFASTASPKNRLSTLSSPFTPSVPHATTVQTPATAQQPKVKVVPVRWRILVSVLEEKRKALGQRQIIRFDVAGCLSRYKMKEIYKLAGVTNYADWITVAEKEGIVETGGEGNARWVALRPEWMAAAAALSQ